MMKFKILSALLIFFSVAAVSQQKQFSILGKVIDSATGQPLAGASALLQNTTYGTISNADGNFFLRLPNGGYELLVSYTGYEKFNQRISNSFATEDTMIIQLVKQDQSMSEVAVVSSNEVENGLERFGNFFSEHFIGTSPNAEKTKIENPEVLRFFYTKNNKRNRLKVTAREPLLVINDELGYRIRYQLDSFSYDYRSDISQYTGAAFFEEIDTTEEVKATYIKNRARTYLGSRLHFMRTLYDQTVQQEGFIVEQLEGSLNKPSAKLITDLYDSTIYSADSSLVEVGWNGRYRVSYKKVFPDKRFLQQYKLPSNTKVQVTVIDADGGFIIEENGYFYEQYDVVNAGYWAWKKLSELLPYDYVYE